MRDSMRMGFLLALGATLTFVGCSDDDEGPGGTGGKGGSAGSKGGRGGTAGSPTGGAAGKGGSAGTGGAAGTAGKGGASGSAGAMGTAGGGQGGTAGSDGSVGSSGAGGAAGNDASVDGAAGADGAACVDDGGAGAPATDGGTFTTAVVLVDNVVLRNAASSIVKQWQFDNGNDIVDTTTPAGDKWTRTQYPPVNLAAGAHNNWAPCDGNPANGSLRNVVPFTAADQYFEVAVPFALANYASHNLTAKVKLVSGGRPNATCPARAELYTIKVAPDAGFPQAAGPAVTLLAGTWYDLTFAIPPTFDAIDQLGVRITTYPCP